ncbi:MULTISPECIES: hypothetical protein [unclassified Rhodococcus (in: high G+C Gram-positive bacteria)]|uniref:hypothetical protein n=1 Tax=unclassified Rhodococcus (in: high G+C Gram-positive bacteria) TaxID=192944 RepID=UPI002955D404|nr:hypothetical protein [Rhodococcus sp. IEGM 1343]MDV8057678.1 hypothetical protein [Rhodococcus sp. IEGM 1343]
MKARNARSIVVIVVGVVLALFFWDLRFFWFQGGPIGCVLVVLAMVDAWESRRGTPRKGLLAELRDDIVGGADSSDTPERGPRP